MSLKMANLLPSAISPMAIPATGLRNGTPQSIKLSEAPQTEAIELEPFDSRISLTMRIVYGNSSCVGIRRWTARSASAPCPTSRRPGPRIGLVSPVLKGGKL